jgi:site-specific recombinase XerD
MEPRKPANKGEKYPADVLSRSEVDRLVVAIDGDSSLALRNRALIMTMYRGGLRVSEVTGLRPGDVDLNTGRLNVRSGKGNKSRPVWLDNGALKSLGRWVERRRSLGFDDRKAYLFCSVKKSGGGGRLATSYLRRLLPTLADRAGLAKRVHPHILRHSRAAELAAAGTEMPAIRDALGHTSLSTTDAYLRNVAPERVREAMQGPASKRS